MERGLVGFHELALLFQGCLLHSKIRLLVLHFKIREKVKKLAIPGMGTGVGRLPYEICALQMKKAVDDIYYEKYTFPKTWYEAQKNHQLLYRKSTSDLQFEI